MNGFREIIASVFRATAEWPLGIVAGLVAGAFVVQVLYADTTRASENTFQLTSTAFANATAIPRVHTCEGKDISPPLAWTGIPAGTKSLALLIDDPDAPDPAAPKTTWTHWVLFNLPPTAGALPAGVKANAVPAGTREGLNDWKQVGYRGPCPPVGRHRYIHHLFALDRVLKFKDAPGRKELIAAIEGHVIAEAQLIGTYQKGQ